ncbi:DUF5665 domain-containing protein [Serpentinicella alkaliphila]|uniref:Uncharacterized protein n=1 Tax=Serpentinicella alkaliphila TaxID=1734049 RepID=A0A4R2TTJ8_9FIRM|nr:DUF5665 domain-containing protein [Serpentinicella alkaliphila]QUH26120.1 hypothetical protein HZR23_10480 [Serpentinicella alkaliphila]TCP98432.1 hypothetical protein EDD79_104014 [Serpentinicella alkaliphila]
MSNEIKDPKLNEKIELLSRKMDNVRIAEYVALLSNPRKLFLTNFLLGIVRGIGMGIGFTLLTALIIYLIIYVLRGWVDLPYIGRIIADLLKIIENYR